MNLPARLCGISMAGEGSVPPSKPCNYQIRIVWTVHTRKHTHTHSRGLPIPPPCFLSPPHIKIFSPPSILLTPKHSGDPARGRIRNMRIIMQYITCTRGDTCTHFQKMGADALPNNITLHNERIDRRVCRRLRLNKAYLCVWWPVRATHLSAHGIKLWWSCHKKGPVCSFHG